MKKTLQLLLALPLLAGTFALLLGDSARKCPHSPESVTFAVSGTCGQPGTITVHSDEDACELTVDNADAVGLPESGELGQSNIDRKDFTLNGPVHVFVTANAGEDGGQDGGAAADAGVDAGLVSVADVRSCAFQTRDAGQVLVCTGQYNSCEATLTP